MTREQKLYEENIKLEREISKLKKQLDDNITIHRKEMQASENEKTRIQQKSEERRLLIDAIYQKTKVLKEKDD